MVRAMDNVIDRTIYPLKEQEDEARDKRRMDWVLQALQTPEKFSDTRTDLQSSCSGQRKSLRVSAITRTELQRNLLQRKDRSPYSERNT